MFRVLIEGLEHIHYMMIKRGECLYVLGPLQYPPQNLMGLVR